MALHCLGALWRIISDERNNVAKHKWRMKISGGLQSVVVNLARLCVGLINRGTDPYGRSLMGVRTGGAEFESLNGKAGLTRLDVE